MEIQLTFRGRIPAKSSDLSAVWEMRKSFHSQLEKLWGKEPFQILKEWEDSDFIANAPRFIRQVSDQTFVPFYGRQIGIGVSLDILLLTGLHQQQSVVENGDFDNRIKRVVDALRAVPRGQKSELLSDLASGSRWYTLMDDDNAVKSITAKLGPFLDSHDPSEAFVLVTARPYAFRTSIDTLSMMI